MNITTSVTPKFIVFHYFIRWIIDTFGRIPYFIGFVGSIAAFCIYAFTKSVKTEEWDRAIAIAIFTCIIVGGLIGLGLDISHGYPMTTFDFQ